MGERPALAAGELHGVAKIPQALGYTITVVTLNFDGVVLNRAAGSTKAFELLGACFEGRAACRQTADHGNRLAAALGGLAEDPHDAIVR